MSEDKNWKLQLQFRQIWFHFFLDPNTFLAKFLEIPISFGNGIKFAAPI